MGIIDDNDDEVAVNMLICACMVAAANDADGYLGTSLYFLSISYMTMNSVQCRSTPVAQLAPRNLLTRWDVSSIPANGIFLTKN